MTEVGKDVAGDPASPAFGASFQLIAIAIARFFHESRRLPKALFGGRGDTERRFQAGCGSPDPRRCPQILLGVSNMSGPRFAVYGREIMDAIKQAVTCPAIAASCNA